MFRREILKAPFTRWKVKNSMNKKVEEFEMKIRFSRTLVSALLALTLVPGFVVCGEKNVTSTVAEMQQWYETEFGLKLDFGNPVSPDSAYTWAICVPKRSVISDLDILTGGKKNSLPLAWEDYGDELDGNIYREGRDARDSAYTVFVRPNLEADLDMKIISNKREKAEIILTTREAIILFRFLWNKHKIRLDSGHTWTITNSRRSCVCVRGLSWGDNGVHVEWCYLTGAENHLRARRAVSAVFTE